jgi:hypothetical protein
MILKPLSQSWNRWLGTGSYCYQNACQLAKLTGVLVGQ